MNGNGRLQIPGQVGVGVEHVPGPTAQPIPVIMQKPGGVQVLIIGGVSAYEQAVMQVAAALATANTWTPEQIAQDAIAIVDAVGAAIHAKAAEAAK